VKERQLGELHSGENAKQGADWKLVENEIILRSKIICCTLAISGSEKLEIVKDMIDYLIVDEAC
jgi:superfamily I DNA and/or RNA helicase